MHHFINSGDCDVGADRWSTARVFQGPKVLQIQGLLTHIKETL